MTIRRVLAFTAAAALVAAGLAYAFCPKPALYGDTSFSAAVTDRQGVLLRLALADDERYRLKVPLTGIAPTAVEATLLYEDQRFRSHVGFSLTALLRAGWSTYVARERVMGGSTITMQLARLRFDLDTTSIPGKLKQIAKALQLERHYSKDEILEAYLNLAPYGGNIEGIGTAAMIYFDKPASELALPEALALAIIPQNPVQRNPVTPEGIAELYAARRRLAAIWHEQAGLSPDAMAQLELPLAVRAARDMPYRAAHFSRAVLSADDAEPGVITTTLDWETQALLEERIDHYIDRRRVVGIQNASAMLLDYRSMEVIASVGSADFFADEIQGQVDGTTAKRSPGSTLKPFVYGLAMDAGIIHPMSLLKDAPKRFAAFAPENFDRGFMGPVFARDALIYSRNVPAIDLLAQVGHEDFHEFLLAGDVTGLRDADHYGLAMVLGGNELTMRELLRLYAMLANGGQNKALLERLDAMSPESAPELLSPEASFLVLDMLRSNPRPDDVSLNPAVAQTAVAWKTGTSYAYRDAWTVGIFGPYVLAVWVGNFDAAGNPALVGRKAAAPLFFEILDALPLTPAERRLGMRPPAKLVKVDVCASTGDLPGRHCPRKTQSWFIPGVSPITVSTVHRAIRIDNATGQRSCSFDPQTTHEEVYEFWPSDLARLFRRAGIARRQPPPWAKECSLDVQAASGLAPSITSPSAKLEYQIRHARADTEQLPLRATTDSDVQWLYWFANDAFIARVARDEALFWTPDAGQYDMLVVDDLGRSDTQQLRVSIAQ